MNGTRLFTYISCLLISNNSLADIVINEIAAATDEDFQTPSHDAIELHNNGDEAVDVSYWQVVEEKHHNATYRIPKGTIIPPNGYHVLMGGVDSNLDLSTFSHDVSRYLHRLDGSGQEIYLRSADAEGNLTGYLTGDRFPSAADRVTLGRHVDSAGNESFVPMLENTLGRANSAPDTGPVVISEIHTSTDGSGRFIEVTNVTNQTLSLTDSFRLPATWNLRGSDFPALSSIAPMATAIITEDDPETFRTVSSIPSETLVFQANGTLEFLDLEQVYIRLGRPTKRFRLFSSNESTRGQIDLETIDAEAITFLNDGSWTLGSAGMEKISLGEVGTDPTNWRALETGTPGISPVTPVNATFPDPVLETQVRLALSIEEGNAIPISELRSLTTLDLTDTQVRDLSWIEYATNLETLSLVNTDVTELYALLNLPNLTTVEVTGSLIDRRNLLVLDELRIKGVNVIDDGQRNTEVVTFTHILLERAVREELGVPFFETELEIRKVDVQQITELFVPPNYRVTDLSGLEFLINLKRLSLTGFDEEDSGGPYFNDLTPLAGLTKLEFLDIGQNAVRDISSLDSLTELRHLNIRHNGVADFSPISSLTKLCYLNLSQNYVFGEQRTADDLSPLAGLTELRYLNLNSISFRNDPRINLTPLAGLTKLLILDIDSVGADDASALAELTKLESLRASRNYVGDLSYLENLTRLRELDLSFPFPFAAMPDAPISMAPILNLNKLRSLSLIAQEGANVRPVLSLPWLEQLNVGFNQLTDLTDLKHKLLPENRSLHYLNVSWNKLDLRRSSDSRVLLNSLAIDTSVYFGNQNPFFFGNDLRIERLDSGQVIATWLIDRSLRPPTLQFLDENREWKPVDFPPTATVGPSFREVIIPINENKKGIFRLIP